MQTIDPFPGLYDADDPFGSLKYGRTIPHTGGDWKAAAGATIPAWCAGTVVRNAWSGGNGNTVSVQIDGLVDGVQLYYSAIHMLEASPHPVGTYLPLRAPLGLVGNTGGNSQGAHLHSSLSDSPAVNLGQGRLQDPWAFIQAHLAGASAAGPATTTTIGDDNMWLIWNCNPDGTPRDSFLFTPLGRAHVRNEYDYGLLHRFITSDQRLTMFPAQAQGHTPYTAKGAPHVFTEAELQIITGYIKEAAK